MKISKSETQGYLVLRCIEKIWIRQRTSVDYDLHVLTPRAVPVLCYETMCAAIYDFVNDKFAEATLQDISDIEGGKKIALKVGLTRTYSG